MDENHYWVIVVAVIAVFACMGILAIYRMIWKDSANSNEDYQFREEC